jgi:transposase
MGYMAGEGRGQSALFPLSLDDLVPADHACRVIDAFVASLDLHALGFARSRPAATGRPGYDPGDLLRLYLYGYLQQIRSSRRLETECGRNIELMWLLGRLVPDHKVIAEFRRVHGEAVAGAGAALIQWARAQALLQGGWVAIDGSKFRAVSSKRSVAARDALAKYLGDLDAADAAEGPTETAAKPHPEPEARFMRSPNEGKIPAYNVQTAVDATTGLIVAHEVTTEATDNRQLLPMATMARQALGTETLNVVADAGYSNGEQARACEEQHLVVHVPANRAVNNQGDGTLMDRHAFTYDPDQDVMHCPGGATLVRKQIHRASRAVHYAAPVSACAACALKSQCTQADRRIVSRHMDEDVLNRMHARATPEAMRLRRCTVERPFAELKYRIFGLPRFLLRGTKGAAAEMAMAVMAFNLKRLGSLLGRAQLIQKLQPI